MFAGWRSLFSLLFFPRFDQIVWDLDLESCARWNEIQRVSMINLKDVLIEMKKRGKVWDYFRNHAEKIAFWWKWRFFVKSINIIDKRSIRSILFKNLHSSVNHITGYMINVSHSCSIFYHYLILAISLSIPPSLSLFLSHRPRFFLHRFIQTVANINLLDPRESRSRNISSGKGKYSRPSKFKHNPFQETGSSIFELFEFRIKFFHSKRYKFQTVEIYSI